jgi:hypothetical protein
MEETRRKDTLEKCLEKVQELTVLINEMAGCHVSGIGGIESLAPGCGSVEFYVDFDVTPERRPG